MSNQEEYDDDNNGFSFTDQEDLGDEVLESLDEDTMDDEQIVDHTDDIMNQAIYRMEEANLFKILINHEIFAPNSARIEILERVNRKIKKFAIRELNLLLNLQKEEPIKSTPTQFSEEEAVVLKMLIGKVLKKEPSMTVSIPERKPEIQQVASPKPTVNQVKPKVSRPAPQAKVNYTKQQRQTYPSPLNPTQKKQRKVRNKGDGFASNSNSRLVKPMPTVEQQMIYYGQQTPQVVLSKEKNVTGQHAQQGAGTMKNIISGLTGGGMQVAIDDSNPADSAMDSGDINGRF